MESILHQATNFGTAIHDKRQRYLPGLRPLFDFACTLDAKSLLNCSSAQGICLDYVQCTARIKKSKSRGHWQVDPNCALLKLN